MQSRGCKSAGLYHRESCLGRLHHRASMSPATISHKRSKMCAPRRGMSTQQPLPRPSFSSTPDLAHEVLASYLESMDIMALMRTAKWIQEAYRGHVSRLKLRLYTKGKGATERVRETEWWWRRVALIRLLGRLSGLTELHTHSIPAVGVLVEALRAGHVGGLEVLNISCSPHNYELEPEIRELALALRVGALPALRELSVGCLSEMGFGVLMKALATPGVCPSLETFELRTCVTDQQLLLVAEALPGRPEFRCLRLPSTAHNFYGLTAVLQPLQSLQTLEVEGRLNQTQLNAVCDYLRSAHSLLELRLHVSDCQTDLQPLAVALKDGMRCLRELSLFDLSPAHPEMFARAVAAAIEAGAWAALEDLALEGVYFGSEGWLTICEAIGRGHGCPSLRRLVCDYVSPGMCGGVALALRMGAFTELQELHMECRGPIQELQEFAAAAQAHGLPNLRTLTCEPDSMEYDISPLADAFSAAACQHLEELEVLRGSASGFAVRLASHMATHALRRLLRLDLLWACIHGPATAALARALIEGGCPQLQILMLRLYADHSSSQGEAVRLLASILGGDAPCSSTLHRFELHGQPLCPTALIILAEGLSKPGAARLSSLSLGSVSALVHGCVCLSVRGGLSVCDDGVTSLLKALRSGAGSKLREVSMRFEDPSWDCIQMWSDAITQGALSSLEEIEVLSEQEPELADSMTEMLMQQLRLRRSSRVEFERMSAALHRWLRKGRCGSDGPSYLWIPLIGSSQCICRHMWLVLAPDTPFSLPIRLVVPP